MVTFSSTSYCYKRDFPAPEKMWNIALDGTSTVFLGQTLCIVWQEHTMSLWYSVCVAQQSEIQNVKVFESTLLDRQLVTEHSYNFPFRVQTGKCRTPNERVQQLSTGRVN